MSRSPIATVTLESRLLPRRQMYLPENKHAATLLIVDDRTEVLRALDRFFKLYFEHVVSAQTPEDAEVLIKDRQPSLLLCDYWLGDEYPPATAFLPRWRKQYPCLRKVALMTGTKSSSITPCDAVDITFQKPLVMDRLLEFLLADEPPTDRPS